MAANGSNGTHSNGTHSDGTHSNGAQHPPSNGDGGISELKAYMEKMHIEPFDSVAVDKATIPLGTVMNGDIETDVLANAFSLDTVGLDIFLHRLDFKKTIRDRGTFPLVHDPNVDPATRPKLSDYTIFENRKLHAILFKAFVKKFPDVFGDDPNQFCYDYAADLFSLKEITQPEYEMTLPEEDVKKLVSRPFPVTLVVQPVQKKLNVDDFKKNFSINLDEHDATVIRFLEMATSRYASERPDEFVMYESKTAYFMNPEKYGIRCPDLGNGKYLAAGVSKAVVCVEGEGNAGVPVVVIDSKKSPFYHSMNLLKMVSLALGAKQPPPTLSTAEWIKIDKYVKRLECFPIYGNRQHIPITLRMLYSNSAAKTTFEYGDRQVSVFQYYQERYNITLNFPELPLVLDYKKVNGRASVYPLELLYVADNQRVSNSNITSSDIATIVRASAVLPIVKRDEIMSCHRALSFTQDGFMGNAAIQVSDAPMNIHARVLQPPSVSYKNGDLPPKSDGRWKLPPNALYVRPGYSKRWGAFLIQDNRSDMDKFITFVGTFHQECRRRGIDIPPCNNKDIWQVEPKEPGLEAAVKESADQGLDFLLIGHPDSETTLHPFIKGIERKYSVITQCVRTKTIDNVLKGSSLSMENIVAKTNVKLGGLNHNIVVPNYTIDEKVLFIGLGMNHPAGGFQMNEKVPAEQKRADDHERSIQSKDISVLGFAANDGILPNEFVGNFFFQPVHRDEKITVLENLLEEVLGRFKRNRGYEPTEVIFYRSGASEGSFPKIIRYEVPILKFVIGRLAPKAKITVILPSKVHSFRFFKPNINERGRSMEQNIAPGTVMDRKVVGKVFPEFFLNSHLAIQGTAKTPKFTILYTNDPQASMDKFQRWTNALAYSFQIVTSPISLPAPVLIALRYSERGRQIFNSFGTAESANLAHELDAILGKDNIPPNENSPENANKIAYLKKSTAYNFTNRDSLRSKRVNA